MKKLILLSAILFNHAIVQAQEMIYKTLPNPKNEGSNMLVGQLQFTDIQKDNTCDWFTKNTDAYVADSNIINALKKVMPQFSIVVFAGTWCEDTQYLLPQFYKILQASNYPIANIQLYGVDRKKQALNIEHLLYKIEKVPTIIFINNHREVARIVESVEEGSLEQNLLRILQKDISTWKD